MTSEKLTNEPADSEEKTVKYPVKKEMLEPKDSDEKTMEYPLPYKEMEKYLKEYDALCNSVRQRTEEEDADDEEAETTK